MYLSSILSSIENTIKEQNPGSKMYPKALNNQYGIDIPLVGNVIISLLFITGTPVIFEYKYNENTIIAVIMHMNIFIFSNVFVSYEISLLNTLRTFSLSLTQWSILNKNRTILLVSVW